MMRLILSLVIVILGFFAQAEQNLFTAIKANNMAELKSLLSLGFDVNQLNDAGISPLIQAINANNAEMVVTLLDSGADVNARLDGVKEGSSAIIDAVKYSDSDILKILIDYGGDLNGSLLGLAYINRQDTNSAKIARVLLENGAFLDEGNYFYDLFNDGLLPDYYPCILENIKNGYDHEYCQGIAKVISEYLNSYSIDNLKYRTLAFAAAIAGGQRIQALIDSGLDPNEVIWRTAGNSVYEAKTTNPLEIALLKHNLSAVQVLLDNGAILDNVQIDILRLSSLDERLAALLEKYGLDIAFLRSWYFSSHHSCQQPVSSAATISFILDDGERRDKEIIETIFEPRNIQGNIAIVAGFMGKRQYMNAQEIAEIEAKGWEISSHSYYHKDLSSLDQYGLEPELIGSQKQLSSYGFTVKSIIYPYGSYNDLVENMAQQAYSSAYTGGYFLNSINSDPYALGRYNINNSQSYSFYQNLVDKADKEGKWLIFALHSSYDLGWEQRQNLDQLLDYICQRGIEILPASQALAKIGLN
ncbi:MAG TPA: hypothetical protein ENK21_10730 [Trueperaceae bacterium]|nr:hypothetical protein [Trueperaceae bacterium]